MKLSLLDMVQNILNAMDSDEVSSIDDTIESMQVAEIVKESYFDIISSRDWPFLRTKFSLESLSDSNNPTKMNIPDDVNKVFWIKYNKKEVTYLPPFEFQEILDARTALANVVDSNGFVLNADPIYWTTFDDQQIVFDGYDNTTESWLQESNCVCYGVRAPTWTHEDTFTPDIPEKFFPTLLAEAKASSFLNLKQQANAREERKAQRGKVVMNNEAWKANSAEGKYNSKINYGRS